MNKTTIQKPLNRKQRQKYPRLIFRVTQGQDGRIRNLKKCHKRKLAFFLRRSLDLTLEHFETAAAA